MRFQHCQQCGRKFSYHHQLRKHRKVHSLMNRTKYRCKICQMSFTFLCNLREHLAQHFNYKSGENLFIDDLAIGVTIEPVDDSGCGWMSSSRQGMKTGSTRESPEGDPCYCVQTDTCSLRLCGQAVECPRHYRNCVSCPALCGGHQTAPSYCCGLSAHMGIPHRRCTPTGHVNTQLVLHVDTSYDTSLVLPASKTPCLPLSEVMEVTVTDSVSRQYKQICSRRCVPVKSAMVTRDETKCIPVCSATFTQNKTRCVPVRSAAIIRDETRCVPARSAAITRDETRCVPARSAAIARDETRCVPARSAAITRDETRCVPTRSAAISQDETRCVPLMSASMTYVENGSCRYCIEGSKCEGEHERDGYDADTDVGVQNSDSDVYLETHEKIPVIKSHCGNERSVNFSAEKEKEDCVVGMEDFDDDAACKDLSKLFPFSEFGDNPSTTSDVISCGVSSEDLMQGFIGKNPQTLDRTTIKDSRVGTAGQVDPPCRSSELSDIEACVKNGLDSKAINPTVVVSDLHRDLDIMSLPCMRKDEKCQSQAETGAENRAVVSRPISDLENEQRKTDKQASPEIKRRRSERHVKKKTGEGGQEIPGTKTRDHRVSPRINKGCPPLKLGLHLTVDKKSYKVPDKLRSKMACSGKKHYFKKKMPCPQLRATVRKFDIKCYICGKNFTTKQHFIVHAKDHLRRLGYNHNDLYYCTICFAFYPCEDDLKEHLIDKHAEEQLKPVDIEKEEDVQPPEPEYTERQQQTPYLALGGRAMITSNHQDRETSGTRSDMNNGRTDEMMELKGGKNGNIIDLDRSGHFSDSDVAESTTDQLSFRSDLESDYFGISEKTNQSHNSRAQFQDPNCSCMCHICGETFLSMTLLGHHLKDHEHIPGQFSVPLDGRDTRTDIYEEQPSKSKFKCKVCGGGFARLSEVQSHMAVHNTKRQKLKCPLCQGECTWKQNFKNHLLRHATPVGQSFSDIKFNPNSRILCPFCGQVSVFFDVDEFKKHMFEHVNKIMLEECARSNYQQNPVKKRRRSEAFNGYRSVISQQADAMQALTPREAPDLQRPLGQAPVSQRSLGQTPDPQRSLGQTPDLQRPLGQAPVPQRPLRQAPVSQRSLGQAPVSQRPLGQAPTRQASTVPYSVNCRTLTRRDIQNEIKAQTLSASMTSTPNPYTEQTDGNSSLGSGDTSPGGPLHGNSGLFMSPEWSWTSQSQPIRAAERPARSYTNISQQRRLSQQGDSTGTKSRPELNDSGFIQTFSGESDNNDTAGSGRYHRVPQNATYNHPAVKGQFLSLSRVSELMTNTRPHTTEFTMEGFPCSICNGQKLTQSNVKQHLFTHFDNSGRFEFLKKGPKHECPICLKMINDRRSATAHLFSHWGATVIKCPVCNRPFNLVKTLKIHVKRRHPNHVFSAACFLRM